MRKKIYRFNFNCSKNQLIIELDKLKVVNTNKSTHTDLLCRNINNEIKFMLYTNKAVSYTHLTLPTNSKV